MKSDNLLMSSLNLFLSSNESVSWIDSEMGLPIDLVLSSSDNNEVIKENLIVVLRAMLKLFEETLRELDSRVWDKHVTILKEIIDGKSPVIVKCDTCWDLTALPEGTKPYDYDIYLPSGWKWQLSGEYRCAKCLGNEPFFHDSTYMGPSEVE